MLSDLTCINISLKYFCIPSKYSYILWGLHWYNIDLNVKAYQTNCFKYLSGPRLIQYWIICKAYQNYQISNTYFKYLLGPTLILYWIINKANQSTSIRCLAKPTLIQYWNHMWVPIRLPVSSIIQGLPWLNIELFDRPIRLPVSSIIQGLPWLNTELFGRPIPPPVSSDFQGPNWQNNELFV